MFSGKTELFLFAAMVRLLVFLTPLYSTADPISPAGREIEREFWNAMKENKAFAEVLDRSNTIHAQIESLEEKLSADNPELKKLVEEQKNLWRLLEIPGGEKNDRQEIRKKEIDNILNRKFASSKEFIALSLRFAASRAEMGYVIQKTVVSSSDKRIMKYNDYWDEYIAKIESDAVKKVPKANVEGSDEYKAAMYGAEKYKEDPVRNKWIMIHGFVMLRNKVEKVADKNPSIQKMGHDKFTILAELLWRKRLLEEKHPELAWEVRTLPTSPEFRTPEGARKYEALQEELKRIIQADPEYARLEDKERTLRDAQMKAVEDFAANSNVQEAVEYRKVMAMLEEANQTSSGKTK